MCRIDVKQCAADTDTETTVSQAERRRRFVLDDTVSVILIQFIVTESNRDTALTLTVRDTSDVTQTWTVTLEHLWLTPCSLVIFCIITLDFLSWSFQSSSNSVSIKTHHTHTLQVLQQSDSWKSGTRSEPRRERRVHKTGRTPTTNRFSFDYSVTAHTKKKSHLTWCPELNRHTWSFVI